MGTSLVKFSRDTARDTPDGVRPVSRAAAAKLPRSTTRTNRAISSDPEDLFMTVRLE